MNNYTRSAGVVTFDYQGVMYKIKTITADEFVLHEDFELTDEILTKILFRDQYIRVYNKSITLLASREHFSKELWQKLVKRGFDVEIVNVVIEHLKKDGLIDDERAAEIFIRQKSEKYGINKLKAMLFEKGVKSDMVDNLLDEMMPLQKTKLQEVIEDKIFELGYTAPYAEKQILKLARFASNRGFKTSDIYQMMDELKSQK